MTHVESRDTLQAQGGQPQDGRNRSANRLRDTDKPYKASTPPRGVGQNREKKEPAEDRATRGDPLRICRGNARKLRFPPANAPLSAQDKHQAQTKTMATRLARSIVLALMALVDLVDLEEQQLHQQQQHETEQGDAFGPGSGPSG